MLMDGFIKLKETFDVTTTSRQSVSLALIKWMNRVC